MRKWLVGNIAFVNLILVISCEISYIITMNTVDQATRYGAYKGEMGGVLDYHLFGESTVYHVTKENLRGEMLFSFWDIPAYFFAMLIILNGLTILVPGLHKFGPGGVYVQWLAGLNLLLAVLGLFWYGLGTMTYVDTKLKTWSTIGGVVGFFFPFMITVTHVYEGHIESSLNARTFDFPSWFLLAMFISTLALIKLQLKSIPIENIEPRAAGNEGTED